MFQDQTKTEQPMPSWLEKFSQEERDEILAFVDAVVSHEQARDAIAAARHITQSTPAGVER